MPHNPLVEGTLPVGDTGEKLDTTVVEQTDGTEAHREGVFIGDPAEAAKRLTLEEFFFPHRDTYAAHVTGPELKKLCDQMTTLIEQQRMTNLYLSRLANEELTTDDLEISNGTS